jgi:SAM-dependent methyltransferase
VCPACGATSTSPLFTTGNHTFLSCTGCDSARLDPLPVLDPAEQYNVDYFVGGTVAGGYADYGVDESLHRHNAADRLKRIAAAGLSPPGTIAEIGSGYGYFLDEARRRGWEVTGTDVSAHARSRAAEIGIELTEDLAAASGPTDVVAAFQVLEHMIDPFPTLARAAAMVRPGGLVIIETWDRSHWLARRLGRRWQQVSPPSVVHLFTADGLRQMATRLRLVDVRVHQTSKYVSLGAVAGQLATGRPALRRPVERVRSSRLGNRAIKYGFGDLVTLTARRSG